MIQEKRIETIDGCVKNKELTVRVPGSKSITNRALLLSTLTDGRCELEGALFSDDSRAFIKGIGQLGFGVDIREEDRWIAVEGMGGSIPLKQAEVYVGSAGTAARFLTALLGLSDGVYHMDASMQMRRRPMAPLLQSLQSLGAEVSFQGETGFFPFKLSGKRAGDDSQTCCDVTVEIEKSSQFLSALLICACIRKKDVRIRVEGTHGMAYIEMTVRMMKEFGVEVRKQGNCYLIPAGQSYRSRTYRIEPDVSAACYFYSLAPLLGVDVTVESVSSTSMQGDLEYLDILERMGCRRSESAQGIRLSGPADGRLHGVEADMHRCSDQAITLAAVAPFADTPTRITGIGHIRFQESDRIAAIGLELRKLGIRCEEETDALTIYPGRPCGGLVHTYEDHRMAMAFALIGLKVPGIVIHDPMCCRKTFDNYFDVLEAAAGRMTGEQKI